MSEDFDKYLAIANHDIQMAKDTGELKSYVASILYDNDKKADMIHELEEEIERLNKEVEKYKKRCYEALMLIRENYGVLDKYGIDMLDDILNGE